MVLHLILLFMHLLFEFGILFYTLVKLHTFFSISLDNYLKVSTLGKKHINDLSQLATQWNIFLNNQFTFLP